MKKFSKLIAVLLVCTILSSFFMCSSHAEETNPTVAELQQSVVRIQTEFSFIASNYDLAVTQSAFGTGFAIGIPGEPVQYIATCNHCISEPNGVYCLVKNSKGGLVKFFAMEEGTAYPQRYEKGGYYFYIDYFKTQLISADAVFSKSSGDYTSISVINSDRSSDVAICKLASDPTTKIQARPFKIHADVAVGTPVYAIGYPYTANFSNDEGRYDYKDSAVTKGIISKSQLQYGMHTQERQFFTYLIDANIVGGNSGGPLITEEGYIIGVNSYRTIAEGETVTANYSIAIDELIKLMDQSSIRYVIKDDDEETEETEEDTGSGAGVVIGIVAAIVVVAAIAVAVILFIKKKKNVAYVSYDNNPYAVATTGNSDTTTLTQKIYLVGVSGLYAGQSCPIEGKFVIGRNADRCNVVYPDDQPGISSVHCEITRNGSSVMLTDLGSTYGTFLANGTRLNPNAPVILNNGDRFWIYSQDNSFEIRS